jgi:head-tail adaptor
MTVTINIGKCRQVVTLSTPGVPVSDGDGGYTQTQVPLDPEEWRCAIESASAASAERSFSATVIAQASHVLTGRFHSGITTSTRMVWTDRAGLSHLANVIGVEDVEGAGVVTMVLVSEVLNAPEPTDTSWVQSGWVQ